MVFAQEQPVLPQLVSGPSGDRPEPRALSEFQPAVIPVVKLLLIKYGLPEECPPWFQSYSHIIGDLHFFLEYGFDTEEKKIDFQLGRGGTYNRVVLALQELDVARNEGKFTTDQLQQIDGWLSNSLYECAVKAENIPRVLNYLDLADHPVLEGKSGSWLNDFLESEKTSRKEQEKNKVFFPEWMRVVVNGKLLSQAYLDYWNFRNSGVKSARMVRRVDLLFKNDRALYEWLIKFRPATEQTLPQLSDLQINVVRRLLTEADEPANNISDLPVSKVIHWDSLPAVSDMEARYSAGSGGAEDLPPRPKKGRYIEVPVPDIAPPKSESMELDPYGRILIDNKLLQTSSKMAKLIDPEYEDSKCTPMYLQPLASLITSECRRIVNRYGDPADTRDKSSAMIDCLAVSELFGQLEQYCKLFEQPAEFCKLELAYPESVKERGRELCMAREELLNFMHVLSDATQLSKAATRLKNAVKKAGF